MWIEALPAMVESYARGLSGSNINFLGKSDDLNNMIGELFFSFNNLKNNVLLNDNETNDSRNQQEK